MPITQGPFVLLGIKKKKNNQPTCYFLSFWNHLLRFSPASGALQLSLQPLPPLGLSLFFHALPRPATNHHLTLTIPCSRSSGNSTVRGWHTLLPDELSTLICLHTLFFPHTLDLLTFPDPEISLILVTNLEFQWWVECCDGTGAQEWEKLPCSPRALLCNRSSTRDQSKTPAYPNQPSAESDQLNTISVPHIALSRFSFYYHPSSSMPHFLIHLVTRMMVLNKIHILKCFGIY